MGCVSGDLRADHRVSAVSASSEYPPRCAHRPPKRALAGHRRLRRHPDPATRCPHHRRTRRSAGRGGTASQAALPAASTCWDQVRGWANLASKFVRGSERRRFSRTDQLAARARGAPPPHFGHSGHSGRTVGARTPPTHSWHALRPCTRCAHSGHAHGAHTRHTTVVHVGQGPPGSRQQMSPRFEPLRLSSSSELWKRHWIRASSSSRLCVPLGRLCDNPATGVLRSPQRFEIISLRVS